MFIMGNWHLLWFLITTILLIGTLHLRGNRILIAAYLIVSLNITFLGFVFGFTEFGRWAEDATIINRLLLHIVPGFLFICLIIVHELVNLTVNPKHNQI